MEEHFIGNQSPQRTVVLEKKKDLRIARFYLYPLFEIALAVSYVVMRSLHTGLKRNAKL
jgi:hypothetical protein